MPYYYDGYDGYDGTDSLEHEIFVKLKSAGFDDEDSNLMARIKVAKIRDKKITEIIREEGVRGLLIYARAHWPGLCNWVERVWNTVKIWFGK